MIKLFFGNTLDGCTDAILQSLPQREKGRQAIIIAPDSYSFVLENKVAAIESDLDVEVMTFARLAMRILGKKIKKCLTPEGCTMLMTKALFQCRSELNCYRASLNRKGFVNEMYSSVTALRSSNISVERLLQAADGMKGYSATKTADLAHIYNAYLSLLSGNYTDPTTRLEALCSEIPHSEQIRDSDFYIVDFYAFNNKQYEVIEKLMRYSHSLSIGCIDCVGGLSNRAIYPYDTTQRIQELAKSAGVSVIRKNAFVALSPFANLVCNKLFDISPCVPAKADVVLTLLCPPSPQDEADEVCREIARLVRGGMRYKDIAVVCGDKEDPTLEAAFNDYSIPYFKDTKVSLTEEPSVKFILQAVDVLCSHFEVNQVMSFIRNPLLCENDKEVMVFENYCYKYAINYSRFCSPFTLGEENERVIPEKIRARIEHALPVLPEAGIMDEYVKAIREFLHNVHFDDCMKVFLQRQCDSGNETAAKRTLQVPQKLTEALNSMAELLHDFSIKTEDFREILFGCLDGIKLSLVPLCVDCVHIGEARDCKFENESVMFFVGAAEGRIPEDNRDGSILSTKFHTQLQMMDLVLRPAIKEENRYSRFCLTQLLIFPSKALIISCPEKNGEGVKQNPSEILGMMSSLFSTEIKSGFGHSFAQKAVTEKESAKLVSFGLGTCKDDTEYIALSGLYGLLDKSNKDKINAVYLPKNDLLENGDIFYSDGYTSVSRMESFFSCPYSFFLKYGLRAKERDLGEMQSNEAGTFIHAVLEKFFGKFGGELDGMTRERALSFAYQIGSELLENDDRMSALLKSENSRRTENLRNEAAVITADLCEFIKQGDFRPFGVEVKFGDKKGCMFPAIKLESGTKVQGMIDRIDVCGKNVAVVDYKSGNIDPKLQSVYYGEKIQLYVYLYALKKSGYTPVGAFYQHVSSGYAGKARAKMAYCYQGQFINDPMVITMFDREFYNTQSSEVLPIVMEKNKLKVAPSVSLSVKNAMLSENELLDVINYVYRLLQFGDEQIKKGYIAASPLTNACRYCKGKNVCGFKGNCRKLSAKNPVDFKK